MHNYENNNGGLRIKSITLFILFTLVIYLPLIDYGLNISNKYEDTENRKKAPLPNFDITYMDPFPGLFDNYYNDNHNFRGDLLYLNSLFKHNVLNLSLAKHVVEGEDGWLYTSKYIEAYVNKRLLTNIELDSLHKIFTKRSEWLSNKGIKQYIAIVPVKAQIYPEFLPSSYKNRNRTTKTEQFIEKLRDISNLDIIYLKDALLSEKESAPYNLYYKTDQHWNHYGAMVGLNAIIKKLREDFPKIPQSDFNNYRIDTSTTDGLLLAKHLMLQKSLKETLIKIKTKTKKQSKRIDTVKYMIPEVFPYKDVHQLFYTSKNTEAPKILVIRDSFTNQIVHLPEFFNETSIIWDTWCYELHEDIVAKENPDIFLTIIIESNIPYIIYKHHYIREDGFNAVDP
jgi:alginate O-acetyltransferase complex protein AlgJ